MSDQDKNIDTEDTEKEKVKTILFGIKIISGPEDIPEDLKGIIPEEMKEIISQGGLMISLALPTRKVELSEAEKILILDIIQEIQQSPFNASDESGKTLKEMHSLFKQEAEFTDDSIYRLLDLLVRIVAEEVNLLIGEALFNGMISVREKLETLGEFDPENATPNENIINTALILMEKILELKSSIKSRIDDDYPENSGCPCHR
ncbi:MAG: hypothetical protein KAI57_00635 [Candidatus Pacebacteria bacterium]|nr:hypothetical protein [Candidatus Paceibacterota bacterium]